MTMAESPYTYKKLILMSIATLIPIMHASYSAMLLVQSKHNMEVEGIWKPLGEIIITPIPLPSALEAPSETILHRDPGSGPSYGPGFSQSGISMLFSFEKSKFIDW